MIKEREKAIIHKTVTQKIQHKKLKATFGIK